MAIREMTDEAAALCANAVAGVDLDYEAIGEKSSMLMVSASGRAPAEWQRRDRSR